MANPVSSFELFDYKVNAKPRGVLKSGQNDRLIKGETTKNGQNCLKPK